MAIAFDTALHQSVTTATNTISLTLGGSADLLIAFALVFAGRTVAAPTWNGTSMTQFATVTSGGAAFVLYGWYLKAPTTGANSLIGTQSLAGNTFYLYGASYSGTDQTTQPDNSNTATGTWLATTQTISLTTSADNCWTSCYTLDDQGSLAASTNSTLRSVVLDAAVGAFDSNGVVHPAGSFGMSQTGSLAGAYGSIMISFGPAATAASAHLLSLTGAGT